MKFCFLLSVVFWWLAGASSIDAQTGTGLEITILPGHLKCGGGTDGFFKLIPKKGKPPVKYVWNCPACSLTGSGTLEQFPQPFNLENLPAGQYSFTFTDASGITLIEQAELQQPEPIIARIQADGDKCLGQNFGKISIESVSGGVPPYLFVFNGGFPGTQKSWENLASGQYFMDIIDASGCIKKEGAVLPLGVAFVLNLSKDTTIFSGDTIPISFKTSRPVETLHWNPPQFASTARDGSTLLFPLQTTTFQAFAVDTNGCGASDRITIQVRNKRNVFAPNIFAPAATQTENTAFFLSGSGGIETIEYLRIFDRVGRLWFEQYNFAIGNPADGWHGDYQGDKAPSGVYVWEARVRYTNGRWEHLTGDVTLLR